jgi:hypothetical protein
VSGTFYLLLFHLAFPKDRFFPPNGKTERNKNEIRHGRGINGGGDEGM